MTRRTLTALLLLLATPAWGGLLFRWTDDHGRIHFADRAPANAEASAINIAPRRPWRPVTVKSVIDGDTFILNTGEHVRVLNINTPETAKRGRPGEALAEAASKRLAELIDGQRIEIKNGEQRRDKYKRELAYVRLPDTHQDISILMLREGFARLDVRIPNTADWPRYAEAEKQARSAKRGIWALPDYQLLSPQQAADRQNRFTRIESRVTGIDLQKGHGVIELEAGMQARLQSDDRELKRWLNTLTNGTSVRLRSKIYRRKGRPTLYLWHISQVETP